jgi:hypothetical protein
MRKGFSAIRVAAARAWARGRGWALTLVSQIRPRLSLAAGSVLVLLTLFIPIAYEACGPPRKGHEFIRGKGIWPGLLTFVFPGWERGFYILALVLAAFTLLLLLASVRRPALLRKHALIIWLFALAGASSLFVIADFFWIFVGDWLEAVLQRLEVRDDVSIAVVAALTSFVLVACLRSRFLRGQRWVVALFAITSALSLLILANFFLLLFTPRRLLRGEWSLWMMMAPAILYWLVPLVLWLRFGLFGGGERRVQWPGIRSRLIAMYLPLVAIDCLFFVEVVKMGIWGFLPFFAGLHLMSLGYMRLAPEAEGPSAAAPSS